MIRVLIADDHPIVREGLRRIASMEAEITVVAEAASAEEMFGALTRAPVDVILLDVSMPGSNFLETLKRIRDDHPSVKILVLSVHPEDQWAVRALRGGASGYLTKDHSPEELVAAVRRVYRGGRYVSASLAERLALELAPGSDRLPHNRLSDREFEVLCALGSGLSVKEASEKLGVSPKTVSTYRTRLMEKMQMATTAELVRYAAQHGLIK
jgi:DNA-binding NarL/FixJ family response regulator